MALWLWLARRDTGREAMRDGSWRIKVADDEYGPCEVWPWDTGKTSVLMGSCALRWVCFLPLSVVASLADQLLSVMQLTDRTWGPHR